MYRRPITKDGLVNAINTCRIFEASFDFWDEDGDGWEILEWVPIFNRDQCTAEANATLTFLRWLIQSSSPDIKANYDTVNVFNILLNAYPGIADAVGLLLELGPPGAIDNLPVTAWGLSPLHHFISSRNWVHVKMVLALGANLHHVCFSNNRYSPCAESPLSMAMYSSWAFWSFRDTLQGAIVDFKDLVRLELEQECPLVEAGWQVETLSTLLELDFEPDVEPSKLYERNHPCDSCRSIVWDVEVQPYWQGLLESIKDGTYPQRFPSGTQDEQSTSSQRNLSISNKDNLSSATDGSVLSHDPALPEDEAAQEDEESSTGVNATSSVSVDRKEVWCIWCWYYFKETGNRRPPKVTETHSSEGNDDSSEDDSYSSEADFSPLLFNSWTPT